MKKRLRTIAVNQAGYSSGGDKLALFSWDTPRYHIIDIASGNVVFTGQTGANIEDKPSGCRVRSGDFSALTSPGEYRIEGAEGEQSAAFFYCREAVSETAAGIAESLLLLPLRRGA
ncbi:cellulase N-terminal Ig-like domain-containing protein [Paenibacillus rhizoplanae]